MFGGHGSRIFFSGKVLEFVKRLNDELPPSEYTYEEEASGFQRLNKAFGFYGTLDFIARYVNQTDKEVLKWNVNEFYTKLKFLSWKAHAQKEYSRLMQEK